MSHDLSDIDELGTIRMRMEEIGDTLAELRTIPQGFPLFAVSDDHSVLSVVVGWAREIGPALTSEERLSTSIDPDVVYRPVLQVLSEGDRVGGVTWTPNPGEAVEFFTTRKQAWKSIEAWVRSRS
jgi:hypothetical protein